MNQSHWTVLYFFRDPLFKGVMGWPLSYIMQIYASGMEVSSHWTYASTSRFLKVWLNSFPSLSALSFPAHSMSYRFPLNISLRAVSDFILLSQLSHHRTRCWCVVLKLPNLFAERLIPVWYRRIEHANEREEGKINKWIHQIIYTLS